MTDSDMKLEKIKFNLHNLQINIKNLNKAIDELSEANFVIYYQAIDSAMSEILKEADKRDTDIIQYKLDEGE